MTVAKTIKKPLKAKSTKEVGIGAPDTKAISHNPILMGQTRIGLAKGLTLNLGNYQSARVEAWAERVVEDNEHSVNEALNDMSILIDNVLEEETKDLGEEN